MNKSTRRRDKEGLDPIRMATDTEVAWAAGVFEGEGSCSRGGHGKRSFLAQLAQKEPELLYRLRDLFGGRVQENIANNRSSLKASTICHWKLCGDRARIFLTAIYPFLTSRRKAQIDSTSVLDFREFVGELPGSGIIAFLNDKLDEWIAMHRQQARKNSLQRYQRYYDKHRDDPQHIAHRREVRRLNRERKHSANSKEGV